MQVVNQFTHIDFQHTAGGPRASDSTRPSPARKRRVIAVPLEDTEIPKRSH
jgi:hypothetical protein